MNQFTNEAKKEVRRLLQQGQKLEAIKYLSDNFGTSLSESKMLVEALEKETDSPIAEPIVTVPDQSQGKLPEGLKVEVIKMLQGDQKMEAIKLVRQNLGVGLKEGLILVEEVQKEVDPNYRSVKMGGGCLGGTFNVVSFIFGFIAVVLAGIGVVIYIVQQQTVSNGDYVQGEVVDFKTMDTGVAPVISYQLKGQSKTYISTLYSTPPAYQLHEKLWMYVSRDDQEDVVIDNFTERWLAITILAVIALLFGFFAFLFRFVARKF